MQSGSDAAAAWVSGIGSLLAVVVALVGFWVVARQRSADRRDAERGVAYELFAVVLDMGNNIRAIEKHFAEQRNDLTIKANGQVVATYRSINPLIGLSTEGELSLPAGSTELLVKASGIELWNDLRLLANRNRALTALMKEHRAAWEKVVAKMPVPEDFVGTIGRMAADVAEFKQLQGDFVQIDSMVGSIESQVADTSALLTRAADRIGPLMKTYFQQPFIHLSWPSGGAPTE